MKIVAVAACTSGIAHTYIAKEKLIRAAEALGHEIPEQIQEADVVILAVDIAITGTERFEGKKQVKVPTSIVVKAPKQLLQKIESELTK